MRGLDLSITDMHRYSFTQSNTCQIGRQWTSSKRFKLLCMPTMHGNGRVAGQDFGEIPQPNNLCWNEMIQGYVRSGFSKETLSYYYQMHQAGIEPDNFTFPFVFKACSSLSALQQGKQIHQHIIRSQFEQQVYVGNALIDMYAKCENAEVARKVFDRMPQRNAVSWSTMITGYFQNGYANEALELFCQMQSMGLKPNRVALLSGLAACAELAAVQQGKDIHDCVIENGFESDASIETALVAMYAKCGEIGFARQLFDQMPERDVVSWSAMIAGYAQNGHGNEALMLFNQMLSEHVKPNRVTIVSVLPACANLVALRYGKAIHSFILKNGFEGDVSIGTALINLYAKCGHVEISRHVFDRMHIKDVVSWSAMIAGYGMHGLGEDALAVFSQMQITGTKPNHVTFTCVLSACSHAGQVDEGWQCFHAMSLDYKIPPRLEHYACMVDLLGRAGHFAEAEDFIKSMPLKPDASVWGALLAACRIYRNIELGEHVAKHILKLNPQNPGYYVLLSNMYAAVGRWHDVMKVRSLMKERGLKKTPGCSLIEVNNRVHIFLSGDRSHPQSDQIYAMLTSLTGQMEEAGYVPNTDFVLHDVEMELKEHMVCTHSEKLAMAFGLISTSYGTPLMITKNLRVCGDCHSATKFISKIVRREIIVRDANRFHHIKDGLCSCRDHW